MKIVTIVGARPQFVKAAVVSRAFRVHQSEVQEIIIHTGQHYDANMSDVFFDEMAIPKPDYLLGIGGGPHGQMTGRQLEKIEEVLLSEKPDWVLVYGDTNSTLAGALAAAKLHIPVAHIEAGLRSFNMRMPEEINRILTDHVSNLLFCPSQTAENNLAAEGITKGVHWVGDVMYDATLVFGGMADKKSEILERYDLLPKKYALATIHREENTDDGIRLSSIMKGLAGVAKKGYPVVLPLHPRTRQALKRISYSITSSGDRKNIVFLDPLSFLDMVKLEKNAALILTDSGGVQKEAFFHGVPCITLRDETEWVETVDAGWNQVVGACTTAILEAIYLSKQGRKMAVYGDGNASEKIIDYLLKETTSR